MLEANKVFFIYFKLMLMKKSIYYSRKYNK